MDNMVRTCGDVGPAETEFNGLREAELELTDAQLGLIYGGCGGSCLADQPAAEGDKDLLG
jgi:hypothetical protein